MTDTPAKSGRGPAPPPDRPLQLPGEEGVWVLVLGDMTLFALFFAVYLYYRAAEPALFDRSQALLNIRIGVANTLLLLTSSWFVVMAVEAVRDQRARRARALFSLSFICGVGFFALKITEYVQKFRSGINLVTNDFFNYYFMYTGIHLLHLTIGLGVLVFLYRKVGTDTHIRLFESGATFWHMVDLLWIMLFPLLYLVK